MQQRWKRSLLLSRRRHRQAACSFVLLLTAHMVLQCAAVVPPNAPRPPREKSGSVTDVAISVEWDAPLSSGPDIDAYELSYRQFGRAQWTVDSSTVKGTPGFRHREIQEVATRADVGQTITSGYFKLSLNFEGYNDFLPENPSRTPPLPWDASADEVRDRLEELGNIGIVEVRRFGPTEQGAYMWRVTFDWERFVRRGNLPMLVVSEVALDVTWSAAGSPVVVTEKRRGTSGPTACIAGVCEYRVGGLMPFTSYQFRLRAHNHFGWSAYGGASKAIRTLQAAPPVTPAAPTASAEQVDRITVRLPAIPPAPVGTPPITMVEMQYQLADNTVGSWTNVPAVLPSATVATATGLQSSTDYRFRARMHNIEGPGPWSQPSGIITTKPAPPNPPVLQPTQLEGVGHDSVLLSWLPGAAQPSDPPVLYYQVQTRINQEGWFLAAPKVSALKRNSLRAVQEVKTRSEAGSIIDSGAFTLSINYRGATDFDPGSAGKTGLIPFDATAEQVKSALEELEPLKNGVEVRRSGPDANGGYTWRITLDWDAGVLKAGVDVRDDLPRLIANPVALGGTWNQAGSGVVAITLRDAERAQLLDLVSFTVPDLLPSTLYQFRVRAVSVAGTSDWSLPSHRVRTETPPPLTELQLSLQDGHFPNISLPLAPLPQGARMLGGDGRFMPGPAVADPDYLLGVGNGGGPGEDGGPGLIVITSYLYNQGQVDKVLFQYQDPVVYNGRPQVYVVPESPVAGASIDFLDVKLWGGGGGGGNTNFSTGGAGAFVQGRLAVRSGDTLLMLVGGGGQATAGDRGGAGGFNGGGDGGDGEIGGGGGGGASMVTKAGVSYPLFTAAGGGGAGATDYCCGHGGPGSGASGVAIERGVGGNGATPEDTPRDNAGDAARKRNQFNDERDETGLEAEHVHLDYGFAPGADYSEIANGGGGAGLVSGGAAGQSGSYVYRPSSQLRRRSFEFNPQEGTDETAVNLLSGAVQRDATQGQRLQGGRGANGKEGGGGGGGGWYGGGGGGAGVDGAGGGGGSSYLHPQAMYESPFAIRPGALRVLTVTATSVLLEWDGVQVGANGQLATAYTIEQSHGTNSDEYVQIFFGTGDFRRYVATQLRPVTLYRFRLIATDPLTGPGDPGTPVAVVTTSIPTNVWNRPLAIAVGEGRAGAGRRAVDAPTAEVSMLPTGLQGATLSPLLGFGFLFGGRSAGEDCDQAVLKFCRHRTGVRNDLWRVDPVTNAWLLVDVGDVKPPARERHLAAVMDDKLLIYAGLTDPVGQGGSGVFLDDLWLLNPDRAERTVTVSSSQIADPVGGDVIPEGKIMRTRMNVEIEQHECTTDVQVWIKMDHDCLSAVKISVHGPLIAPYREPATDWPFGERLPLGMGLGEETVLLRGGVGKGLANKNIPCSKGGGDREDGLPGSTNVLLFADDADTDVQQCCEDSVNGTYRPIDVLKRYTGLPPTGEWVLNIYDGSVDGLKGHLYEWGITMNLVPCNREYSWTQLGASTASNRPPARHDATGVVVGHSWFIWGGMTHTKLEDMWRFDLDTDTWTQLTMARRLSHAPALGRAGVLSPWGVVTWGGRNTGSHHLAPQNTYRWDVIDAQWVAVRPPPASDPRLHEAGVFLDPNYNLNDEHLVRDFSFSALKALQTEVPTFPPRRMLHAMALFGVRGTESYRRGVKQPRIFVFGGYNGNTELDDVWELTLFNADEGFEFNSQDFQGAEVPPGGFFIQQRYDQYCAWHGVTNTTGDSWYRGCSKFSDAGVTNSTAICDPQHVLIRAWCEREYQSIGRF